MLILKDPLNVSSLISQMCQMFQIHILNEFYTRCSINTVKRIEEYRKSKRWGTQLSKTQGSLEKTKNRLASPNNTEQG